MKLFGQDVSVIFNQVCALIANIISWFKSFLWQVPDIVEWKPNAFVEISGAGGSEKLQLKVLPVNVATVGYNVKPYKSPFAEISLSEEILDDLVLIKTSHFSVNYADVCIRWGLYERFVHSVYRL